MKLNEQIRENRKKVGLTQEQVAQYLGVSTPAVNKWEKGITYPDVTVLPVLARLLKIDLNTLFCFQEEMTEAEIKNFTAKLMKETQKDLDKGFQMAMEKTKEFPNCMKLLHSTATTLDMALILSGLSKERKLEYEKKTIALYERVAEGNDQELRELAAYMLTVRYMNCEEYGRAQKMVDQLPDRHHLDKRELQADLYLKQEKLSEPASFLERRLQMLMQNVQTILIKLTEIAIKEGNSGNAEYIADISKKTAELFSLEEQFGYIASLEAAVGQKKIPESISLIEKMMTSMQTRWAYEDTILFHHIAQTMDKEILEKLKNSKGEYREIVKKRMLPPLLAELENSPKYEFLRSDKRFQEMMKRYKTLIAG